jgi:hypothetical protein
MAEGDAVYLEGLYQFKELPLERCTLEQLMWLTTSGRGLFAEYVTRALPEPDWFAPRYDAIDAAIQARCVVLDPVYVAGLYQFKELPLERCTVEQLMWLSMSGRALFAEYVNRTMELPDWFDARYDAIDTALQTATGAPPGSDASV